MRLLKTSNPLEFAEFISEEDRQRYAILSHTWGEGEEVSLRDLGDPTKCARWKGYRKIEQTCAVAASNGLDYAWVDTCCINKESSAELSEAINSMFEWCKEAAVCYVFLADLAPAVPGDPESDLDFASSFSACAWLDFAGADRTARGFVLRQGMEPSGDES